MILALLLTACTVGRSYTPPHLPDVKAEVIQERHHPSFRKAEPVKDWWSTLEDKQLSRLVEQALRHNHDIAIAMATMEEARIAADAAELNYYPKVTTGAYGQRKRDSAAVSTQNPQRVSNTFQAGFDASWEIDFFGRIDGQLDKDTAFYESATAQLQGVQVTIAAEVARYYIELRGSQQRLEIAKSNAANQEQLSALAEKLEASGRSSDIDLNRALAVRDQTLALIPLLEAQINASTNRLAVLTGQMPDTLRREINETKPLPTIPSSIAVGDAGGLLKRRPDVRAAERELAASVADYNIKAADLYPRVTINGAIGFMATRVADLLTGNALTSLIQPTIFWSAFDRARVKARMDAADARSRGLLAAFDKTVLVALEEMDSTMVNFSRQQVNRGKLASSASAAAKAYDIAKKRYEQGLDSLPDLLAHESRWLEARDRLTVSETQTALQVVALYKALGGGWEVAPHKTAAIPKESDTLAVE